MARLVQIGVVFVVVAGLIAVLDFAMNPSGSPVRTTLKTVRDAAVEQYQRLSGQPATPATAPSKETAAAPAATTSRPSARGAAAAPTVATPVSTSPAPAASPAPGSTPPTVPAESAPAPAAPTVPRRGDFYLPGWMATWTSY